MNMKTKEVEQFIRMLDTYSDDKYAEIRMAAGDHLAERDHRAENLENACLPGESNYISYILHWYKKHEIIPIILLPDAAEPNMMVEWEKEYTTRTMKRKPSKKLLAAWQEGHRRLHFIDNDMKNFKNECEKVRVQIGLNFLGDSHFAQCNSRPRFWKKHGFCWSPLHYKNKKYLVFDNPCPGGAVMNAIAIPLGFLKKCLVLDFIPS